MSFWYHIGSPKCGSTTLQNSLLSYGPKANYYLSRIGYRNDLLSALSRRFPRLGLPVLRSKEPIFRSGEGCVHEQTDRHNHNKLAPTNSEVSTLVSREDTGVWIAKNIHPEDYCRCTEDGTEIRAIFLVRNPLVASIAGYYQWSVFRDPRPTFLDDLTFGRIGETFDWRKQVEIASRFGFQVEVREVSTFLDDLALELNPGEARLAVSNQRTSEKSFQLAKKLPSRLRLPDSPWLTDAMDTIFFPKSKPLKTTLSMDELHQAKRILEPQFSWLKDELAPVEFEIIQKEEKRISTISSIEDYLSGLEFKSTDFSFRNKKS